MVDISKIIHDKFIETCAEDKCTLIGLTLFERIFNFIDETIFNWGLYNIILDTKSNFIVRKMDNQTYPIILYKYNNLYILSIMSNYYKQAKQNLSFFISIVQFCMIDLIMAIANRLNTSIDFVHQGPFYLCLLEALFSIRKKNQYITVNYYIMNQPFIPVLMSNWQNSCYIDSLLTILLLGDCVVMREILFKTKKFTFDINSYGDFINPTNQEITDTEEKAIDYAINIQKRLKIEYKALLGSTLYPTNYQCKKTRDLFSLSNPGMKNANGGYVSFYASVIYETLVRLFRSLEFCVPILIYGENNESPQYDYYSTVFMQDYMLGEMFSEKEIGYQSILWDKPPVATHLVFVNNVNQMFKNYAEGTPKAIMETQDENGNPIQRELVNVERWFGEYILNGAYRLVAAILHWGSPNTGGHYNAYLRPFFDRDMWYFYDDIAKKFQPHGIQCPPQIFWTTREYKPEILFYVREVADVFQNE